MVVVATVTVVVAMITTSFPVFETILDTRNRKLKHTNQTER
jgi:hypothetical protein